MTRHSLKENNKPPVSFKSLASVLRPIRDWLHNGSNSKTSTPISNPIPRTSSRMNNSSSNSYGESLTGLSSNDMLSTAAPTPIQRYTPVVNGNMMSLDDQFNGCLIGRSALSSEFSRSAQARMSLPNMQQNKLRRQAYSHLQRRGLQPSSSLGHIYLQHKGETKQANLPNELTTIDTLRALFVCAFPHLLSMEYMSQPHVKIYIYNPSCNIFYELVDIENVKHESVLRIHQSDPLVSIPLPPQIPAQPQLAQHHYSTIYRMNPERVPPQIQPPQVPILPPHMMPSIPSQIPPPKPRRMIPSNYLMHRVNPQ